MTAAPDVTPEELRARIRSGGWTSRALADAFGLHPTTLSRYCSGAVRVPAWLLLAIDGAEQRDLPRRRKRRQA